MNNNQSNNLNYIITPGYGDTGCYEVTPVKVFISGLVCVSATDQIRPVSIPNTVTGVRVSTQRYEY